MIKSLLATRVALLLSLCWGGTQAFYPDETKFIQNEPDPCLTPAPTFLPDNLEAKKLNDGVWMPMKDFQTLVTHLLALEEWRKVAVHCPNVYLTTPNGPVHVDGEKPKTPIF